MSPWTIYSYLALWHPSQLNIFKNKLKIPTNNWIHACSKNCCRPSKTESASAMDEGNNKLERRVTTITMAKMELPDCILHPMPTAMWKKGQMILKLSDSVITPCNLY